jgi:polar amino acid transport system substrate-binding protein
MSGERHRSPILCCAVLLAAISAGTAADQKAELAPTGPLRVGVASAPKANVFFVVTDRDGAPRGVTAELAKELARDLGLPIEFVVAHNSGELTDALEKGAVDLAFLPVDEERRKRVDFGPAYVEFESTCLVLGHSAFRNVRDLDRAGVRVGGEANTTTIRAVARVLASATIVPIASVGEAITMLRNGEIDAFALGRQALAPYQREIAGSRILDGYFHKTGIAVAVPKNRPDALAYVRGFMQTAKTSGLIRRIFDDAGLQSTAVAPAE